MLCGMVHVKDYVRISAYACRMHLQLYAEVITGIRGSHMGVRGYQHVRVRIVASTVMYVVCTMICAYVRNSSNYFKLLYNE